MADTPTTNYGLNVPTDGADDDVWGVLTNENWTTLDTALKDIQDQVDANAAALIAARMQIGDIWGTTRVGDPATLLGYGTWEAFAVDQTAVGAGGAYALGDTGGAATVTLTEAQMPSHNHSISSFNVTSGGQSADHTHGAVNFTSSGGGGGNALDVQTTGGAAHRFGATDGGTSNNHTHTTTIPTKTTTSKGSDAAHNNMQPYVAINYWKRTA